MSPLFSSNVLALYQPAYFNVFLSSKAKELYHSYAHYGRDQANQGAEIMSDVNEDRLVYRIVVKPNIKAMPGVKFYASSFDELPLLFPSRS